MQGLRAIVPASGDFVKTDCERRDRGYINCVRRMADQIGAMPSVQADVPIRLWFAIKDTLGRMKQHLGGDYIGYRAVSAALSPRPANGTPMAQDTLSTALHCWDRTHYKDDPSAGRTSSVLNPQWVTNGIYGS